MLLSWGQSILRLAGLLGARGRSWVVWAGRAADGSAALPFVGFGVLVVAERNYKIGRLYCLLG